MPLVKLSPIFNSQIVDENGDPANGWKINTYLAGSSTPASTYTDSSGTVAQSNPIIINSLGFTQNGQIWLTSGMTYKLVLTDANNVVKKTVDNISGINDTSVSISQWQASGITPTYISATSFTLPGDQTSEFQAGRRLQFTTTAGTVYGSIRTSVFTTLTTITMLMDLATILDSGLSVVNLSILRADHNAIPVGAIPIRSATASNSATIDFTLDTNIYESFYLAYTGALPATNSDALYLQGFVGGIIQNSAVYQYTQFAWVAASGTAGGATNATSMALTSAVISNNVVGAGVSGSLSLFNAASTTQNKQVTGTSSYFNIGGVFAGVNIAGAMSLSVAALSGIRIGFVSGNIASGSFTLYGLKKAF